MTRSVRLRPWQKAALEKFVAADSPDFLAVATPGAGKTTFALTAARHVLAGDPSTRVLVVAPTAHLKLQWAQAAARFDLHLDPEWTAADGVLPADMHGIVTTYQQVASNAEVLRGVAAGSFVVFDEIHHAGDDRAWGHSTRLAFSPARRRLAISGTPFRSDTQAIPFVRYVLDEAAPDFEYGYGEALSERRVVRPVYFPRINGHMEWSAPDGSIHEATFDDALDRARSSQRLRTALSLDGEWLPTVLRQAIEQLDGLRATDPAAGGLVIAADQEHARGIAAMLRDRFGRRSTLVTSDDPDSSSRIARFRDGTEPWLVAVRMVSEGVDIPRLRVGVFASTTTTELFFRQAVGRLVRWTHGVRDQKAFMFIPDDPRLRARAFQIGDQRRHSLRRREAERAERDPAAFEDGTEEQLSLFAALSAVATDRSTHATWDGDVVDDDLDPIDDDPSLVLNLGPPPPLAGRAVSVADLGVGIGGEAGRTRREQKRRLRERNSELVQILVRRSGRSHAEVNAELNRMSGVSRIAEATVAQLQRRVEVAERLAAR